MTVYRLSARTVEPRKPYRAPSLLHIANKRDYGKPRLTWRGAWWLLWSSERTRTELVYLHRRGWRTMFGGALQAFENLSAAMKRGAL